MQEMIQEISYNGEKFSIPCITEFDENIVFFLCEKFKNGSDVFRCIWENHWQPYDFFSRKESLSLVEIGLDNKKEFSIFSDMVDVFIEKEEKLMRESEPDFNYSIRSTWY